MQEKFALIKSNAVAEVENVNSTRELNDLKVKYLGKSGEITALLRGMKDIPAEKRSEFGKMVNDLKVEVGEIFEQKEECLKEKELQEKFEHDVDRVTRILSRHEGYRHDFYTYDKVWLEFGYDGKPDEIYTEGSDQYDNYCGS